MKPEVSELIRFKTNQTDFLVFLVLIFVLPFGFRITTPVIALWTLSVIISFFNHRDFSVKHFTIYTMAPLLLFGAYLISIVWSENPLLAWSNIEIKLSLLIVPLLFPYKRAVYSTNRDLMLKVFIAGTIISSLFCFSNALFQSVFREGGQYIMDTTPSRGWGNNFTYTDLSVLIHPGYLAMYLNLSLAAIIGFLEKGTQKDAFDCDYLVIIGIYCFYTGNAWFQNRYDRCHGDNFKFDFQNIKEPFLGFR